MKIEIWSDYACPFCYVAKQHFDKALAQFDEKENIEIVHKAFRLDPTAGEKPTYTMKEKLQKNYGKSEREAIEMMNYINQAGAQAGVVMNVENVQNTNTLNAHRLLKFAERKGLGEAMNNRLYLAYFTESQNLADISVLTELAAEIGLDKAETETMLQSDAFYQASQDDEQEARAKGIQAVPAFVLNGQYLISGAQPPEAFLQAFKQLQQEEQSFPTGAACGIDGCH